MNELTNLKLDSSEIIHDLVRAEELQLNLSEVNEIVGDQMLCSVVLKGLPQLFVNFFTDFKYSHELKSYLDLKKDLLNFDSESFLKRTDQSFLFTFRERCAVFQVRQVQSKASAMSVRKYCNRLLRRGKKSHKANACPKAQKKPFEKRNKEIQKQSFSKRNEGNLTMIQTGLLLTRMVNVKKTLISNFRYS